MTALPQHLQALASANAKRTGVAAFRIECSELNPAEAALKVARAIEHDHADFILGSARIGHLLRAIPRLGWHKCGKCLSAAGVHNDDRRLRDLTSRQRGAIVIQLEMWAERWNARHPS